VFSLFSLYYLITVIAKRGAKIQKTQASVIVSRKVTVSTEVQTAIIACIEDRKKRFANSFFQSELDLINMMFTRGLSAAQHRIKEYVLVPAAASSFVYVEFKA
jgi:hypothetical protein